MEQKFTVFFDDDGFQHNADDQGEFSVMGLDEIIEHGLKRWPKCKPIAWASDWPGYVAQMRDESIAAGRTIEFDPLTRKYVPRGVPIEEAKPAEPEQPKTDPLQTLRELVEIQGREGTWNHDGYMVGLFNGLELALATMEGRDPQYRTLRSQQPDAPASTAKPPLPALTLLGDPENPKHGSAFLSKSS